MSDMLEAIKARRTCRKYTDEQISTEEADKIIEAGLYAASGMGKQGAIIVAVTDQKLRNRLSEMNAAVMGASNDPFYGAPAVFVVLGDRSVGTYLYDGSLVMGNMMLEADALGLGSAWIHRAKEVFDSEEGKQILRDLGVEGDYEGIGNLIVGHRDGQKTPAAPRKENRVFKA